MALVESFFGQELTEVECWEREAKLHPSHREGESDLIQRRWFDYRHLLPAQATYLFAAQYQHEFREAYKRVKDIASADALQPLAKDIFTSDDLISIWLARRDADQIGCKYDFYLRFVFNRFASRGWKNLPRPNQVYSEEISHDASGAWADHCRDVLQLAERSFFTLGEFVDHPDQHDYHRWVIGQIKRRDHKHLTIARVLNRVLPPEMVAQEFGGEMLRRAQLLATQS